MRIIAGKYRGRTLKSPPSLQTRPTSDRLRETLFNILAPRIEGARFLDLCAGSGAVGIEALSRGALHATLVDQSEKMCGLMGANVEAVGIADDDVAIVCSEAAEWLQRYVKKDAGAFDVIFFDPPYAADYAEVLNFVADQSRRLLTGNGIIIVEHYKKKELPDEFGSLHCYRSLNQGDSCLSFYEAS